MFTLSSINLPNSACTVSLQLGRVAADRFGAGAVAPAGKERLLEGLFALVRLMVVDAGERVGVASGGIGSVDKLLNFTSLHKGVTSPPPSHSPAGYFSSHHLTRSAYWLAL